jgi:hypothetical protein
VILSTKCSQSKTNIPKADANTGVTKFSIYEPVLHNLLNNLLRTINSFDSLPIKGARRISSETIVLERIDIEPIRIKIIHGMKEKGAMMRLGSQINWVIERREAGYIKHHKKTSEKSTQSLQVLEEEGSPAQLGKPMLGK